MRRAAYCGVVDRALLARQPTLTGALVRCEPVTEAHLPGLLPLYAEPDELAGPLAALARERARQAIGAAAARDDRADWAVVTVADHLVVGEVVLFDLDELAESMEFRIALVGPAVFGRGYGSAATRLVTDFALDTLGLHRLSLHVAADNARAIRAYERAGFVHEGRRREVNRVDGGWVDELDLALLATDPRPLGGAAVP